MPRLALLGAFPLPATFGSQRYFSAQARALTRAGADVTLFCYGSIAGADDEADPTLRGLRVVRAARLVSPRTRRAGPSPVKPLADLSLGAAFLRAARREAFDAVLAHNAEGAAIALAARALGGPPVVYVAHTLMGSELDAWAPAALGVAAAHGGGALDRFVAARADAVIALCRDAADALRPHAGGPLACIPPGHAAEPAPAPQAVARACTALGVTPGGFALYTGNVDRYQELDVLAEAARRAPELPVVVATHGAARFESPGITCAQVAPETARALTYAAAATLLTRRRPGGFPIKLLEYMQAGRAIVARRGIADGLEHGRSAWLVPRDADPEAFAAALRGLRADAALRARLGAGARQRLEAEHAWPGLVERTLALTRGVRRSAPVAEPARSSSA